MILKFLKEIRTRLKRSRRRVILKMLLRRKRRKNQMMKRKMKSKKRMMKFQSPSLNLILCRRLNKRLSLINLQILELRTYLVLMIRHLLQQSQEVGQVILWEACFHHQPISNNHWQIQFKLQNLLQLVKLVFLSNQLLILKEER